MKVAVFNSKAYVEESFRAANADGRHDLTFLEARLSPSTAILAQDHPCVCAFVNDELDAGVLIRLARQGVRLVALRCAGFNQVDLVAAEELGLTVARVPAYSPDSVAEHTVCLMLSLNRRISRAFARVRDGNFSLDGLMGFEMRGRTVGIIGTGKIGQAVARILRGFACNLLAHDVRRNPEVEALGARYAPLDEVLAQSDILTLHCPLLPETRHLIGGEAFARMKPGAMLINTSRGALVDTLAAIQALKSGKLGYLGLDVYEEEGDLFFEDLSGQVLQDDVFARLLTFPNVVITGHQAFFTREAVQAIAEVTLGNITEFERTGACTQAVTTRLIVR